jgi:P4 family phage/plasmid primase-like protien
MSAPAFDDDDDDEEIFGIARLAPKAAPLFDNHPEPVQPEPEQPPIIQEPPRKPPNGTAHPAVDDLPEDDDDDEADELPDGYSEDHLTHIFTKRYGLDWRYVSGWSSWRRWDGAVWQKDTTLTVFDLARKVCREISILAPGLSPSQKRTISSARTIAAIERVARTAREHAADVDQWDADPWVLSTPNGLINLRTGSLRAAKREDYTTKQTSVSPLNLGDSTAHCPTWCAALQMWCGNDIDLEMYLQRFAGYCLTGITSEHALAFFYGTGRNGKSVFLDAIREIMGDYATVASMEMFQASQNERHSTEIADLMGARLVTAQETQEGRRWDEAKIKEMTSASTLKARFMRQDYFEFKPQFKLLFAGNHKPGLRSVDEAIKARVHIVPFTITIPEAERDKNFPAKLRAEYPGILQWMIDGCRAWQSAGLNTPAAVRNATESYLESEDSFAEWLEQCCQTGKNAKERSSELYKNYSHWADRVGEYKPPAKRFNQLLDARGYLSKKIMGYKVFYGIGLKQIEEN